MKNVEGNKTMMKKIDSHDDYIYADFVKYIEENDFDSYDEVVEFVTINTPRVLAQVLSGEGFFLKKDEKDLLFNTIKKCPTPVFTYMTAIKRKGRMVKLEETINLSEVLCDRSVRIPKYSTMAFKPRGFKLGKHQYNLWNEFIGNTMDVKFKVNEKRIKNIQKFIKEIICDNDPVSYKYILSWLHHIVTKPYDKTRVCIFTQSSQGAGKGSFVSFLINYVFGNHLCNTVCGIQPLVQKHNKVLMNKIFISVDELPSYSQGAFHGAFDKMKHLITEHKISIEPKGQEVIEIENKANIIMSTNNKFSLKVEQSDRRYFCLRVSDSKIGNTKYWDNLRKNVLTKDGGKDFYHWLFTGDFDKCPLYPIPMNKFKEELIIASENPIDTFLKVIKEKVNSDNFTVDNSPYLKKDNNFYLTTTDLWNKYKVWCDNSGERAGKQRMFSSMLKERIEQESIKFDKKTSRVFNVSHRQLPPDTDKLQ